MNADISQPSSLSTFDKYLASIAERAKTFAVRMTDRPTLVFNRGEDWDGRKRIQQLAIQATTAASKKGLLPQMQECIGGDAVVAGRAVHMAERHIGILEWVNIETPADPKAKEEDSAYRCVAGQWQQETFVAEKWGQLQFLKMAKQDPHAFDAVMSAINDVLGVGWSTDDAEYFQNEKSAT